MSNLWGQFSTHFGECTAWVDGEGRLTRLYANARSPQRIDASARRSDGAIAAVRKQVLEYCEKKRRTFDLQLAPAGTPFQQTVWDALKRIRYGETISYGALARRLGQPNAARAIGIANAKNPIWLIIPCHRVIGADGSLTGYAGGLPLKKALLTHEGALQTLFPESI